MTTQVGNRHPARTIVGYCWPWSVRPGERLNFMVSTDSSGGQYRADLVRIICAEGLADPSMFKVEDVRAPFAASYGARHQETHLGSYVEIAPHSAIDELRSFTVQVMVKPTVIPAGVRLRPGGFKGFARTETETLPQEQHVVSRWDSTRRRGWALILDTKGCPAFISSDGASTVRTTLAKPLTQDQWFFLMAVFNPVNRTVSIYAKHQAHLMNNSLGWPEARESVRHADELPIAHEGPLRFAACSDGPGNGPRLKPGNCFNGRLDRVRLSSGALTESQALALANSTSPPAVDTPTIGFWDFGKGIDSIDIFDLSVNQLHGVTVNTPMRAVTGMAWDGSVVDWRQCPGHYSAIHFHDDDLYDAEWASDFGYTVPEGLPSGIYAARLRHEGSEDYVPFFVCPPRGKSTASVAVLIPTATYTAYTNIEDFTTHMKRRKLVQSSRGQFEIVDEDRACGMLQDAAHADYLVKNARALGKGLYANHTDGTLFAVASQKHPNMTVKPGGIQWTLVADSLLVDWLTQKGISHDIITDELLHREGLALLSSYQVIITGNHPEYYSAAMMDSVARYLETGGRLMYLGGNGFFFVTSFNDQLPGAIENRKDIMFSGHWKPYEIFHSFDGARGGRWEDNPRSPYALVGVSTAIDTGFSWEGSAPYRRLPDSYNARAEFVFDGVSKEIFGDYGLLGGGAAGQEFDSASAELGTPAHALLLARADKFPTHVSMLDPSYAPNAPTPFGDVLYFETPNGGAVFSAASMSWVGSLSHNSYQNDVSRITENVVRRFLDASPLECTQAKK